MVCLVPTPTCGVEKQEEYHGCKSALEKQKVSAPHQAPQRWGSHLKCVRNIQGRTGLYGFRERTGGAVFSQTELLAESMVSLLSPATPGIQRQVAAIAESPTPWLKLVASSW